MFLRDFMCRLTHARVLSDGKDSNGRFSVMSVSMIEAVVTTTM